jgi:hypothetical protein
VVEGVLANDATANANYYPLGGVIWALNLAVFNATSNVISGAYMYYGSGDFFYIYHIADNALKVILEYNTMSMVNANFYNDTTINTDLIN